MIGERSKELLAMLMIGDGALAFVDPQRHTLLWQRGPDWWQRMVDPFVQRPQLTRWLGAAGVLAGLWLASRQRAERQLV